MPAADHLTAAAAGNHNGEVNRRVVVTVSHPGAVEKNRVVEQGAVPVRSRPHPLRQAREQGHVVGVDPRVLLDLVRLILMVRHRVMPIRHTDVRIGAATGLPCNLHAGHTGHVGAVGQEQQVDQQTGVLVVLVWNARRLLDGRQWR